MATAVELAGNHEDSGHKIITVRREVISSAGTYCSPQILMVSAPGPQEELKKRRIQTVLNLPVIGRHSHDYCCVNQWYNVLGQDEAIPRAPHR